MKNYYNQYLLRLCTFWPAAIALLLTLGVQSCKNAEPVKPPPPAVTVSAPVVRDVQEWDTYSGRLESPRMVNLSARVSGLVEQAPFTEGALVHQGDLLFVIDSRSFKADLASAHAAVAKAKAQFALADVHYKRYDKIRATKAISAEDFDQAAASLRQAEAELASATAAEQNAQLNLDWTRVTAPLDGRISRKLVTEGNLVNGGSGQATLLTTIASIDPLFCYFNVPEREFLKYQALTIEQKQQGLQSTNLPCNVQLENESTFNHEGMLDFVDNRIDPGTGTIQLRCSLPNHDGRLTPGLFARMRISGSKNYKATLVPDAAVGTDQNNRFLLVVGQDNILQQRSVTLGPLFGSLRAISQGIKPEDRIVVNGMQAARPGMPVTPTEAPIPDDALLAAAAAPTQGAPQPSPAAGPAASGPATGSGKVSK